MLHPSEMKGATSVGPVMHTMKLPLSRGTSAAHREIVLKWLKNGALRSI